MRDRRKGGGWKVGVYYIYLLLVWGVFRWLVSGPVLVVELLLKPVIWMGPLWWLWLREKEGLYFFSGSAVRAVRWGLGLGLLYGLAAWLAGWGKYGGVEIGGEVLGWLDVAGIGLATAVTEQMVFSGYVLQKLERMVKLEWQAIGLTAGGFALLHVPMAVFVSGYGGVELAVFLAIIALVSVGNCWIMLRTRNVAAPILSHWFWGMAIYAFG